MRGVAGLQAKDDFHQRHHRHRVEEVHADEAVGALGRCCQLGDADRTGVGGHDHLGREHTVELLQDLDFEPFALGGGFDHQLRTFEVVVTRRALNQAERGVFVGGAHLFFLDQAVQAAGHCGQAFVDRGLVDVDQHDADAVGGANLGDAVAHGARADDADGLDGIAHAGITPEKWKNDGIAWCRQPAVAQSLKCPH